MKWINALMGRRDQSPSPKQLALELIAEVDSGAAPYNPDRVTHVARSLGLEVSRRAPVAETIVRIRNALARRRN